MAQRVETRKDVCSGCPVDEKITRVPAPVCYLLDSSRAAEQQTGVVLIWVAIPTSSSRREVPILWYGPKMACSHHSLTRFETTQEEKLVFQLIASLVSSKVEGHQWGNEDDLYPGKRTTEHKQAENGMACTLPFFFVVLYLYTVGQLVDRSRHYNRAGDVLHKYIKHSRTSSAR